MLTLRGRRPDADRSRDRSPRQKTANGSSRNPIQAIARRHPRARRGFLANCDSGTFSMLEGQFQHLVHACREDAARSRKACVTATAMSS